jgi:hypothetical protein
LDTNSHDLTPRRLRGRHATTRHGRLRRLGRPTRVPTERGERRAGNLLTEADQGGWPDTELHQFLDYLHLEVLRQVTDEEWLLFRTYHHDPQDLAPLHQDHLQLRGAIEALTAASVDTQSPQQLAAAVRELITALARPRRRRTTDPRHRPPRPRRPPLWAALRTPGTS